MFLIRNIDSLLNTHFVTKYLRARCHTVWAVNKQIRVS